MFHALAKAATAILTIRKLLLRIAICEMSSGSDGANPASQTRKIWGVLRPLRGRAVRQRRAPFEGQSQGMPES